MQREELIEQTKTTARNVTRMAIETGVLSLIIGTVMAWFAPHGFWPDIMSNFRAVYLGCAIFGAVSLAILRRPRWALVSAVVAAANVAPVVPWVGVSPETPPACATEDQAHIVVINAFIGNERFDLIVDYVRDEDPDILVISELYPDLGKMLEEEFPYAKWREANSAWGIGIFSKYPLGPTEVVRTEIGPPQLDGLVHGPKGDFRLLAAHPPAPGHPLAARERNEALELLAERARTSEIPVVLAGDLNVTMWSPHYEPLEDAGLRNAREGRSVAGTFPQKLPPFRVPIDHVMHTSDIAVCDFGLGRNINSDHLPITARIVLPESERTGTMAQIVEPR